MTKHVVIYRTSIVATGVRQTKLMMGMPFADMLKPELMDKDTTHRFKIVKILVEEGGLMVGVVARANGVQHHRYARRSPIAEQLSTSLDMRIVQYAARKIIQFALIDKNRVSRFHGLYGFIVGEQ